MNAYCIKQPESCPSTGVRLSVLITSCGHEVDENGDENVPTGIPAVIPMSVPGPGMLRSEKESPLAQKRETLLTGLFLFLSPISPNLGHRSTSGF
jgi:hypothetical protein